MQQAVAHLGRIFDLLLFVIPLQHRNIQRIQVLPFLQAVQHQLERIQRQAELLILFEHLLLRRVTPAEQAVQPLGQRPAVGLDLLENRPRGGRGRRGDRVRLRAERKARQPEHGPPSE